jgi:hypothetical protein
VSEVEGGANDLAALHAAPCTPQGGAKVGHGAGALQSRGRTLQRVYRSAQQLDATLAALGETSRAEGDPTRPGTTERLGERDLLNGERSRFCPRVERELREGGVGAPRDGRTRAAQASKEVAGGDQVVEGQGRAKLGEANPAAGGEQPRHLEHRRELLDERVPPICCLGDVELPALGEGLEQHREHESGMDAGQPGAGLKCDACVRFGVGEVANSEMDKGAVAGKAEHVRERAESAGV